MKSGGAQRERHNEIFRDLYPLGVGEVPNQGKDEGEGRDEVEGKDAEREREWERERDIYRANERFRVQFLCPVLYKHFKIPIYSLLYLYPLGVGYMKVPNQGKDEGEGKDAQRERGREKEIYIERERDLEDNFFVPTRK